jgi:hypothetical protein
MISSSANITNVQKYCETYAQEIWLYLAHSIRTILTKDFIDPVVML